MELKWIFNVTSSFEKLWNTKYYQKKPTFNGVYSGDNLPKKIKGGTYVINPDEYAYVGLLCFAEEVKLFYFHSLVLNMFLKKLKNLLGIKPSKLTFPDYNQTIQ